MQEVGIDEEGKTRVVVSEKYYRPSEVDLLIGNSAKAISKFGWNPQKTTFEVRKDLSCIVSSNTAALTIELRRSSSVRWLRRIWSVRESRVLDRLLLQGKDALRIVRTEADRGLVVFDPW
jgi:hypothetical protein